MDDEPGTPVVLATTEASPPIYVEHASQHAEQVADERDIRAVLSVRSQRRAMLRARYGGFYWGADFIGFTVATFFSLVFGAIVGGVTGAVGYRLGAQVPRFGRAISITTQNVGIAALAALLIALFLAFIIGGYTAGRMARFDGIKNGLGVVLWSVIMAILLAIAGGVLDAKYHVIRPLHLNLSASLLSAAGTLVLIATLIVMVVGGIAGGLIGEHFHWDIDHDAGA
jgi:Na+-driven multidrug efflux pump